MHSLYIKKFNNANIFKTIRGGHDFHQPTASNHKKFFVRSFFFDVKEKRTKKKPKKRFAVAALGEPS